MGRAMGGAGTDGTAPGGDAGHERIGPDGKVYRHGHGAPRPGQAFHGDDGGTHEHVAPDGTIFRHRHHDGERHGTPADANRRRFAGRGIFVLHLMAGPGAGKTTLLARTLADLKGRFPMATVAADPETGLDADRLRAAGSPAIQINTGETGAGEANTGRRLDAPMLARAADALETQGFGGAGDGGGVLFVENVGTLAGLAGVDLGETHRVVLLSVTEGEDIPRKHPALFAGADLLVVGKTDLLPHLNIDLERMIGHAQRANPSLAVIELSAATGRGLEEWYGWIADAVAETLAGAEAETGAGAGP